MKNLLIVLLLVTILIIAGCVSDNQNLSNSPSQASIGENFATSDPSAPASFAEKYCLDVTQTDVIQQPPKITYDGSKMYYPLVTIVATVKSNCQYPVEGVVQLFAYDKNHKMIPELFANGVQDGQPLNIKPGQTKTVSTTFDMRRVPDNPRDTDPTSYASFNVTTFVTHIVSARNAAGWQ